MFSKLNNINVDYSTNQQQQQQQHQQHQEKCEIFLNENNNNNNDNDNNHDDIDIDIDINNDINIKKNLLLLNNNDNNVINNKKLNKINNYNNCIKINNNNNNNNNIDIIIDCGDNNNKNINNDNNNEIVRPKQLNIINKKKNFIFNNNNNNNYHNYNCDNNNKRKYGARIINDNNNIPTTSSTSTIITKTTTNGESGESVCGSNNNNNNNNNGDGDGNIVNNNNIINNDDNDYDDDNDIIGDLHGNYNINNNNNNNNKDDGDNKNIGRNIIRKNNERRNNDGNDGGEHNNELITELLSDDPVDCKAILNINEDDEMTITGYKRSKSHTAICYMFFILTGGLLRLIMHWWPHWLLLATHIPCPLNKAEKLLIEENYQGKHTLYYVKDIITLNAENLRKMNTEKEKWTNYISLESDFNDKGHFGLSIQFASGVFKKMDEVKMFRCKQLRYVWDTDTQQFVKLSGLDIDIQTVYLHHQKGLSEHEQYMRRLIYGTNEINIPLKTVMTLLFLEVLNPFYVFQVFSVCLWFSYNYYYYAIMIILMTAFGITMSIKQTRKNQLALYRTVTNCDEAFVLRDNGELCNINTKYLVPGDLLEIPSNGCTMQCDAILLSGNCILDESMLTGESVPVTKTPLPCKRDQLLDTKEHARHMLYCGTKIIQTRYIGSEKVLAVIINTGNKTAKGGLIRSILYPPPVDYKFEKDSYKFIGILGVIAVVGFFYTLSTKIQRGMSAAKIAIESLDLITIAVPPALPAAMAVGRMYAQKRLKQDRIYCISPRSINVSGSIDCVCFDKTGTLTEDGLDMWGVVPKSLTNSFQMPLRQLERLPFDNLLFGMVTCHSITLMNGDLKGDPLDLKMFESTGWILEEANISDDTKYDLLFPTIVRPPKRINLSADLNDDLIMPADTEIGIVREFSFTSSLQRMSVITRKLADQHFNVYCKGSPEMIITLCNPSTIPDDFHSCLDKYAQQGYRIIAVAYKPLDKKLTYAKVQRISRDKVETDLEFQGFVILENRLKQDTTEVISQLMKANIRTIMVTGDNILTALSVAKDCGMVTHRQSVITVNVRPSKQQPSGWELYYNLTCPAGRPVLALSSASGLTAGMPEPTQNGFSPDYHLMTNSNSIASFETIDTFTQTTNLSHRDVELGMNKSEIKMAPDLPSNNYRFAMIGKTWAIIKDHYPEMLPRFVTRGTVFARMSPDQKQALVLELQGIGYYVAMCGDGANDCGALKAAHTGISLSEAESSVASPFTSKNPTIACVPNVIKEGRAALVTSFGIFKYMAAYSVVQFASVIILYSIDSNLTDTEFLYIDLFLISIFAFFFGQTKSYDGPLVKQTPLSSLVSLSPIASLMLQLIVAISFQAVGWYHLQSQPWFEPFNFTEKNPNAGDINLGCQENYTIFAISCFQYIILAFVFSKGAPYRKAIYTNKGFLISLVLTLLLSLYLVIAGVGPHVGFLELDVPPDLEFRLTIVFCAIINFIIAFVIEEFVIEYLMFKKIRYRFHNIEKSRRKFLAIENYLRLNPAWPSLSCYPNDVQAPTPNNEAASPNSYAEIGVEHDIGSPFDQNSSVLNSFFEAPDDDIDVVVSDDEDDDDDYDDVIDYPVARGNSNLQSRNDSGIGFEPQQQSHQINNTNGQSNSLSEIILMPQSFQQYKPNYHHQLQRAHEHQQQQLSLLQPNRVIANKAAAAAAASASAAAASSKCTRNDEQSDLPLIEKIQLNYLENDNDNKIHNNDNVTEFSNIIDEKMDNKKCSINKKSTTLITPSSSSASSTTRS